MKKALLSVLIASMLLPLCAAASLGDDEDWYPLKIGSVSFRIGYFYPRGESDIWTLNIADLSYQVKDFNGFMGGFEFNWFATRMVSIAMGVDFYKKTVNSMYVDFVADDGSDILQDITLEVYPITATVKFMPLGNGSPGYRGGRGSPVVPWFGGGVGLYPFRYQEVGEFVDFTDYSLFYGEFIAEEMGFGFHVAGGVAIPIGFDWDVCAEVRYAWAEGDLGEDFLGYDNIDLGGLAALFGFSYRF